MNKSQQLTRRTICPTCDCWYRQLIEMENPDFERYPILTTSNNELNICLHGIKTIENVVQFDAMRKILQERYQIHFRLNGRWEMIVERAPWICQSIRSKIKSASQTLFPRDEVFAPSHIRSSKRELLKTILDRDSLFGQEERE